MRGLGQRSGCQSVQGWPPGCGSPVHLRSHAVCAGVTWRRSASSLVPWTVRAWCVLLCLPLQQTTVLAVCPFCKDREVWKERYRVSAASFSISFTPRFPGTAEFCNALDMFLLCFKDSSWQGPEESTSAEPKGVSSGCGTEIPSLAFLKKSMLKGADPRTLYPFTALFLLVLSSAVLWVLLSELSGPVRHKPPSLLAREGDSVFSIAEMTKSMEGLHLLLENHISSFCPGHAAGWCSHMGSSLQGTIWLY